MTKEIETWWNAVSKGYQEEARIRTDSAHYGPFAPDENKLRLLGNVKGKKILEIGCGGGQCSIAFVKQGATCTGLDLSEEQLKYAEKLAKKENVYVKFIRHDIQTLKGFESDTYDIIFSAFALLYVPDLTKCFKEVFRVLKKDGLFVFSSDHPFYTCLSPETYKIERSYNKTGKLETAEIWPGGKKQKFVMYRRKISETYDSLTEAGFSVERIIEEFDKKTEKAWKEGGWKKVYEKNLIEMVCPTIIFKARKE